MAVYDHAQLEGMLKNTVLLEAVPGASPVFAARGIEMGQPQTAAPAAQNWDFLKGPGGP